MRSAELDSRGTNIWNLSTKLRRGDESSEIKRLVSLLRAFAMLMLDAAQQGGNSALHNSTRLFRVSLKAAKTCLDSGNADICLKMLEKAAKYESEMSKPENRPTPEDDLAYKRLSGEYFVMRTALVGIHAMLGTEPALTMYQAWKQSRLDLAEHMFEKTARVQRHADPATAERLADVLYEMGKDLLEKKQNEMAVRWLERAYDTLAEQDLERLSNDAGELRLSIMHSLVRSFIALRTAETRAKAWDIVRIMENDFGDKLVVSLLKLELLSAETELNAEAYGRVLDTAMRTTVLTDASFKTLLHHIHKLRDGNALVACTVLEDFLEVRLYDAERHDWLEKAIIVRIWLTTAATDNAISFESIQIFLEKVSGNLAKTLSSAAAHAVLTLLWKRIEAAYNQAQYEVAEAWCEIAYHRLFENSGEVNIAIIARKGIRCAVARHDHATARKIYFQMPEATRAAPQTKYLMYKVAIRSHDIEFASECLESICQSTRKDATLLYACVLEAQQSGNRQQAITALQQTIGRCDHTMHEVHLPALFRCTARLIVAELASTSPLNQALVSNLCSLFENATAQARTSRTPRRSNKAETFTHLELEWFAKNAYNLALKHCADMHPRDLLRLLQSCMELLDLIRADPQLENRDDLLTRLLFCHFLAASASIALARAEDNTEQSAQQYMLVQSEATRFGELLTEASREAVGEAKYEDLQSKRFELLRFQLECAVRLGSWNELDVLLDECVKQDRIQRLEKLADLVFSIHASLIKSKEGSRHQSKLLATIQKVITLSWRASGHDMVKVSRWLRCLFSMALMVDANISLMCLDQAAHLVRQAADTGGIEPRYPVEELEWLATTAFNRSVDLYCASDDDGCRLWAAKALGLAKASVETEALYAMLQSKYSGLRWGGQE
ncbi:MAG: hypothetical protein M1822_008585 [Bathelium mastoideum]|nr:MAG: hypothetical protein M1822_008585 [Bathelium mastoideum]